MPAAEAQAGHSSLKSKSRRGRHRLAGNYQDKMSFTMPELIVLARPSGKGRKKPQHWAKNN